MLTPHGKRVQLQERVLLLLSLCGILLHVIDLVPFYRYWKSSKYDHFYTINIEDIGTAIATWSYRPVEKEQCLIFSKPWMGTVPLCRYRGASN